MILIGGFHLVLALAFWPRSAVWISGWSHVGPLLFSDWFHISLSIFCLIFLVIDLLEVAAMVIS